MKLAWLCRRTVTLLLSLTAAVAMCAQPTADSVPQADTIVAAAPAADTLADADALPTITAAELDSPMMGESRASAYEESLWTRLVGFYNEWPLLTLLLIWGALLVLFYAVKKIAIALA